MADYRAQGEKLKMTYGYQDMLNAYSGIGLNKGSVVYVISALWQLIGYEEEGEEALARANLNALREVIGEEGTIVVSTASMNLCNTEIPFDIETTPSFNAGLFSEYVRMQLGAKRSFHPFGSYAALGTRAEEITASVSRHMYGPETPEARMVEMGAIQVNIGLPPNITSTVHYVEQAMGVPYRYTKEFLHPVMRSGKIVKEPFYLYVRNYDANVERNHCKRLFSRLDGKLPVVEVKIGRARVCAYSMADYYAEATRIFADNIYIWCEKPPSGHPFWV